MASGRLRITIAGKIACERDGSGEIGPQICRLAGRLEERSAETFEAIAHLTGELMVTIVHSLRSRAGRPDISRITAGPDRERKLRVVGEEGCSFQGKITSASKRFRRPETLFRSY